MPNDVWDIKSNLRVQYFTAGAWTSIQADAYEISIDRGIMVEQGVFCRPDVGTLQVRLIKASLTDLVTGPAYQSNMPIRVQYQPLPDSQPTIWRFLFYGFISNISMNYDIESKKLKITIDATDSTKILMNTRLSTFIIDNSTGRSFRNAMNELGADITAVDSRMVLAQLGTAGSAMTFDAITEYDTISGEWVNLFLDGELGWCFADRGSGTQNYLTRNDINALQSVAWSTSNLTISNQHSSSTNHVCMDYIDLKWSTDELVNSVKVEHDSKLYSKTAKNTSSITAYGEWPADFVVSMDVGSSPYTRLQTWADDVVAGANPKQIRQVSCPALRRDGTTSRIADREIADTLQVEFVDPNNSSNKIQQVLLITRLNHEITADHWEVGLGLWRGI